MYYDSKYCDRYDLISEQVTKGGLKRLSKVLRRLRKETGVTISGVASKIGFTEGVVARVDRGASSNLPKIDVLEAMCCFYGVLTRDVLEEAFIDSHGYTRKVGWSVYGAFLKYLREERGLSLEECAKEFGTVIDYLYSVEEYLLPAPMPSPSFLRKISEFYGVSGRVFLEKIGYKL